MGSRRRVLRGAAGALAAALVVPGGGASAAAGGASDLNEDVLSARVEALARPGLARASHAERDRALSLPRRGPGSLVTGPDGSVRVSVRLRRWSDDAVARVRAQAVAVPHVSRRYLTVTADVAPNRLSDLGALPGVAAVNEVVRPFASATAAATQAPASAPAESCGWLQSSASEQLRAGEARDEFDVDGSGVTIGVLSSSFAAQDTPTSVPFDIGIGALPGPGNPCGFGSPVQVLQDHPGDTDEGRAMLQLIHGVAPGARLIFATANISESSFADNIHALVDAGADVIVDDVVYQQEPIFQDGDVANAVTYARDRGVPYFAAAGNFNAIVNGRDVGSFEAPDYRPMSCPAPVAALPRAPADCMNFAASGPADSGAGYLINFGRTLNPMLQWAQPLYGVDTEFTMYLVRTDTNQVVASGAGSGPLPLAYFTWSNPLGTPIPIDLVIGRTSGTALPRVKFLLLTDSSGVVLDAEYSQSAAGDVVGPSVIGHAGSRSALAVGAIPYDENDSVEDFSSRGPVTHYFAPVSGTTPALPLSGPSIIPKPAFVATDDACTTFFGAATSATDGSGPDCPYRFSGTSAAAPNAAAVAALMLQEAPDLSPAQVGQILADTAAPLPAGATNTSGAGLVDAVAAVGAARALLPGAPTAVVATAGDGRATVRWQAPARTGASRVRSYSVSAIAEGRQVARFTCSPAPTTCTLTGLRNGRAVRFRVAAVNSAGPGPQSSASAPVTPSAPQLRRQHPVRCGGLPRRVRSTGVTTLLARRCTTNAGRRVRVRVFAGTDRSSDTVLFRIVRAPAGKVRLRTFGSPMRLRVVWRAHRTGSFAGYRAERTYVLGGGR